jgi:hypothetical protein
VATDNAHAITEVVTLKMVLHTRYCVRTTLNMVRRTRTRAKVKAIGAATKQCGGPRVNFNALVKALTPKELHRNKDD